MKFDKAKFIYNSNAIEGVDTPIKEIEMALSKKKASNLHVYNHMKAFDYVNSLKPPMTSIKLLEIHKKLSFKILETEDCGNIRKEDVHVVKAGVTIFAPPNWKRISALIKDLIYAINLKKDPWLCHMEFEYIHPFIDFNGRIGRMLLYWQEKVQSIKQRIILNDGKSRNYYDKLGEYEKRSRPTLWSISIWKKILTRNQTYVCMECATHYQTVIKKCTTCGNSNESKFQIYTEAPPFVGPIV